MAWLFLKRKKFGGLIEGHGLTSWWADIPEKDRALIRQCVGGDFSVFASIDSGPAWTFKNTKAMLAALACWFQRDEIRHLGRMIMQHAEAQPLDLSNVLDAHYMFQGMLQFYYRCRNDSPEYLGLCEAACREMIKIAPLAASALKAEFDDDSLPAHLGYGRLCWLLDKRGDSEGKALREEGARQGWKVSI